MEDEQTRDEVREMATDTDIMATSSTKLTHPIRLARSFRSSFARRRLPLVNFSLLFGRVGDSTLLLVLKLGIWWIAETINS